MNFGLSESALHLICSVLSRHNSVSEAFVFGSRALGRETPRSDIDIALVGKVDALEAEGITLELDELPIAAKFDLHVIAEIQNPALRDHIARVGRKLYSASKLA